MSFETFRALIAETAGRTGYDAALLAAQAWQESRFKPDCVGTHEEVGLMQVTETAGKEWARSRSVDSFSRDSLFNPATNIQAGTSSQRSPWPPATAQRKYMPSHFATAP